MGELLRRYWHPVAVAQDLDEKHPVRLVRLLSESLVLFRDKLGGVGLMQDKCPHQGTSMLYGFPTKRGLACPSHGWLFETGGFCLGAVMEHIEVRAYTVREQAGLYWAYLGPKPAPALPLDDVLGDDVLGRTDRRRRITVYPQISTNWFAESRYALDPWRLRGHQVPELLGDPGRAVKHVSFSPAEYGISKEIVHTDGSVKREPLLFPTHLRAGPLWLLTPVDATQTQVITIDTVPIEDRGISEGPAAGSAEPPEVVYLQSQERGDDWDPNARCSFYSPWGRALGADADQHETPGLSLLQDLLLRELDRVARGEDPIGVIRDVDHPLVPTE